MFCQLRRRVFTPTDAGPPDLLNQSLQRVGLSDACFQKALHLILIKTLVKIYRMVGKWGQHHIPATQEMLKWNPLWLAEEINWFVR